VSLPATSWLRAAVLAFAAAVLWWPLAPASGVAAAVVAAGGAALAADLLARRPRRTPRAVALALAAAGVALLGALLSHLAVRLDAPAAWLGAGAAVQASEAILAFLLTAPCVFLLRWLAARHPAAGAVEVALAAAALAASLAAHREGMVHLPLAIGDLAWTRGFDPTLLFLALGAGGVVLLAALLLAEEQRRRIPLHLGVVLAAALLLAGVVRLSGLPQPRAPEDLGLTGATGAAKPAGGSHDDSLDDLAFRDEYRSDGGRAPVAVVVFHGDYEPPSGVLYFRQSAFSSFNGRRLVQATQDDVDRDLIPSFPSQRAVVAWAPPAEHRQPLRATTGLLVDHVRPFALDSPVVFEPRPNADAVRFQRVYDTLSLVPTASFRELLGRAPGAAEWSEAQWAHYTAGPADPRYGELAAKILASLSDAYRDDPFARAFAVKRYLEQNGSYSRKSHHTDAADPVASFLFGDVTGYCVHFAHAAVYLLRALGVPARVAAGYAVPDAERGGGSAVLIRGLDAHAWPEIRLDGVGWVVVDVAPERVLDPIAPRPDSTLQTMLGELLRGTPADQAFAAQETWWWPSLANAARVLAGLAAAALALASLVKLERRLAPRFARAEALPRLVYRCALDRLADAGAVRRFGESRERFARRVGGHAPSFAALTALHLRRAFGGSFRADPGELHRLGRSVAGELRTSTPRRRRVLGSINPFSWFLVR